MSNSPGVEPDAPLSYSTRSCSRCDGPMTRTTAGGRANWLCTACGKQAR